MQKIMPYLWFSNQAEEAVNLYTSLFKDSKIVRTDPQTEDTAPMSGMPVGSVLSMEFEIAGHSFGALNGGAYYTHTPAVSLSVACESEEEIDNLRAKLGEGGKVLMPLQKYPFSEKYGWVEDKYGISWQLNFAKADQKIRPTLMFTQEHAGQAEEAMNYYCSLFKNSKIDFVARYEAGEGDVEGTIKHAVFSLDGEKFIAMDSSGPHKFTFSGAISFLIYCEDQTEIDHFRNSFADGGAPNQCGRINDKYGVTRQVCPRILDKLLNDPDPAKAKRAMQAMMGMIKLDIAELEKAAEGK